MTDGQTNNGSDDAGTAGYTGGYGASRDATQPGPTQRDEQAELATAPHNPWWATPVVAAPNAAPNAAPSAPAQPDWSQPVQQPEPVQPQPLQPQPLQPQQPPSPQASWPPPSWPPPSWQSPYAAPTIATPYGDASSTAHRKDRSDRRLPSLLLVALIAALVGAAVGAGFVAATKKTPTAAPVSPPQGNAAPTVVASLPAGSVASVAQTLLPSVVSITVTGLDQQDEGTGIILSADGQILTNNHVVESAASAGVIAVTFSDGRTVTATIVGRDPTSDLAVVKAQGVSGLHPATMGKDSSLVVGQQVVAVGSPLGLSNSVTSGIVSSLNRPVCTQNCGGSSNGATPTVLDAIQTDAAINPGNSGGPLVDMAGRVIGINSAIATLDQQQNNGQSGNIGVGFAIPIDEASRVVGELQKTGHASHAVIGIGVDDSVDANLHTPNGAKIVTVNQGGPADKAGLKVGDVLVKFGDRTVVDADSLIAATHAAIPNSTVTVAYLRGGRQTTTQVTLSSATSG
jgi:putative serine protease PepD